MESNYIKEFLIFERHMRLHQVYKRKRTLRFSCSSGCASYTHSKKMANNHSVPKTTHIGRYLPFSSQHSLQLKLSIPQTLLSRAENIIKEDELKKDEIRTINNTLITNKYPRFHCKRWPARSESKSQRAKIMTVVPYEQNFTESMKSVSKQVDVGELGVAMKPVCVLSNIFCKPKDKVLDRESRTLFIKYFFVTSMLCATSVKHAEA